MNNERVKARKRTSLFNAVSLWVRGYYITCVFVMLLLLSLYSFLLINWSSYFVHKRCLTNKSDALLCLCFWLKSEKKAKNVYKNGSLFYAWIVYVCVWNCVLLLFSWYSFKITKNKKTLTHTHVSYIHIQHQWKYLKILFVFVSPFSSFFLLSFYFHCFSVLVEN